ncbi:MAG: methyltransferase domain-containing protein [Thaumarchaeota archaeon]|nr:methyltransferase domain-containing protein [Nitrososphaerota archaeon]
MNTMSPEYIFILIHSELSLLEIHSYLHARRINHKVVSVSPNAAILAAEGLESSRAIKELGGCFKVCAHTTKLRLEDFSGTELLRSRLRDKVFYDWLDEKVPWAISVYDPQPNQSKAIAEKLRQYFAERLKEDGASKAKFLETKTTESAARGVELLSTDYIKKRDSRSVLEIVAARIGGEVYVGCTVGVSDNEGFHKRDMERPIKVSKISLAPRLARMLVNLTGVGKGMTLLDPFCGTGTILQEALVMGLNVLGADIDSNMVRAAEKNLKWTADSFGGKGSRRIIKGDARHLSKIVGHESVDAIATEPILLPLLKKTPSRSEAEHMLAEALPTYRDALVDMEKVLKKHGRSAIVVPQIRVREGGTITLPFKRTLSETAFQIYMPENMHVEYPLRPGSSSEQKVLRSVYVLVKAG